jgi:glucose/arabinose dehydrogenase
MNKLWVAGFLLMYSSVCAQNVTYSEAFPGLTFTAPVELLSPPDNTKRLFVVQQNGIIKVFKNKAGITSAEVSDFLNISSNVTFNGEAGLLGMAFHPQYATNGYFYVTYTRSGPLTTVVSRFTVKPDNANEADPLSELILFTQAQPYSNHNGGKLAFGTDGFLYISLGDGGSAGDPQNYAQNLSSLLGKILRLDVNQSSGSLNYSIPESNPLRNNTQGYREEIYAYGLRNVWKFSIDQSTNTIWAADVGQGNREEIDIITNGGNYGWRLMEGTLCYNPSTNCNTGNLILPIFEYPHTDNNRSITGGYVYRGVQIPEWQGHYIYGDYISGRIWKLEYSNNTATNAFLNLAGGLISSFGEDHNGELYVVRYSTSNTGRIFRYFPEAPAAPGTLVLTRLSGGNELTWEDQSNNELGFIIERSPIDEINFEIIDSVQYNTTSYNDSPVDGDTEFIYRIKAYNDGGESDYALTEMIISSIQDQLFNEVRIYPNPSYGTFTVELPEGLLPASIRVLNMLGQEQYATLAYKKSNPIEVRNSKGIYLIEIKSRMRSAFFKLAFQ